ncbi:HPr kinase/phosphorylase [Coralliovum pocilloporae]|uniref:HPr kinase/phosphorylase n=1 Tax=Coralliovum pocilloporae TaxID=3066369 RepID=UPI00330781B9
MTTTCLHATTIRLGHHGVMIRGASGSGKSSLAAHILRHNASALVSDDYTSVTAVNGRLIGKAPDTINGLIEIRGKGIERFPAEPAVCIHLVVDLLPRADVDRMPEPEALECTILDVAVKRQPVPCFDENAEDLIRFALRG